MSNANSQPHSRWKKIVKQYYSSTIHLAFQPEQRLLLSLQDLDSFLKLISNIWFNGLNHTQSKGFDFTENKLTKLLVVEIKGIVSREYFIIHE